MAIATLLGSAGASTLGGTAAGAGLSSLAGPLASGFGSGLSSSILRPGASSAAISGGNPISSDRNFVNIAPVGVNVGEIFRNLEGPTENGGFGLTRRSRLLNDNAGATLLAGTLPLGLEGGVSANVPTLLLFAAGAGILLLVIARARRR